MSAWHYVQNGQPKGPVDDSTLQTFLGNGTLPVNTLVWREGMPQWLPAREVAELAGSFPPGAPPPIPQSPILPPPLPEAADIEQNKVFAVLAYIGPLFLVPLLAAPHSRFARYHTNQGVVLFLVWLIVYCGVWLVTVIPLLGCLMLPLHFIVPLCGLVLMIIGIVNAAGGQYKPLPWIGHYRLLD